MVNVTAQSAASLPPRIGRFVIQGVLGKGAQGVVYLAVDPELQRQVAIKTLRRRSHRWTDLLAEARAVATLSHPNIVPVYEAGEHAGTPYVVYEHVKGTSLKQHLRKHGALPPPTAIEWISAILDAVALAHDAGIVHRDLNPANVLLDGSGRPRVMDFGIATPAGTVQGSAGEIIGTANYMAPEQTNAGTIGPATDIFALGLILHEMLTGRPAVDSTDPMAAMYQIAHAPLASPSKDNPAIGGHLDAVVAKAVSKDPADRYVNAREMKQALAEKPNEDTAGRSAEDRSSTLGFVLRRMRRKPDFPAISRHISEISRKTAVADRTSVNELAGTILKDYALATKLLRVVNSSLYGQYGGRISTISRALVILGFDQVRMIAHSLLLFEHLKDRPSVGALREAAGHAFLSGAIGRTLAQSLDAADPEEAFVCAMLHTLGRYLTIYYLSEEYAEIVQAMASPGTDESAACRSVIGLTYEELGIGVLREWQLPDTIVQSLRRLPATTVPKNKDARDALRNVAAFSNELCETVLCAPPERRTAALGELRERFRLALPVTEAALGKIVRSALKDAQVFQEAAGVNLGQTASFANAHQWVNDAGSSGLPVPEAGAGEIPGAGTSPQVAETPEDGRTIVINGIQDISNALLEGRAINDILAMVLETLFRGLDFSRVILFINDLRRQESTARFGLGTDTDQLVGRLRFPFRAAPDLFTRAVREKRDLLYPQPDVSATDLPAWYTRRICAPSFVLLPIVVGEACIGLIYGDYAEADRRVTGDEMNYLNTLRNQAALAIRQGR